MNIHLLGKYFHQELHDIVEKYIFVLLKTNTEQKTHFLEQIN